VQTTPSVASPSRQQPAAAEGRQLKKSNDSHAHMAELAFTIITVIKKFEN